MAASSIMSSASIMGPVPARASLTLGQGSSAVGMPSSLQETEPLRGRAILVAPTVRIVGQLVLEPVESVRADEVHLA
jgi:hypothetical protein